MTKDRILEVATKEFSKYGYDAVSMNNLVKKLDINKATIYYHYKDKKTLYLEVMKRIIEILNKKNKLIFEEDLEPKVLLRTYMKAQCDTLKEEPEIAALALREFANLGADIDETIVPLFEEDLQYLQRVLNKLDVKEHYKDISVYAFNSLIMGTVFTFYSIQMSELPIGTKDSLKKDANGSIDYVNDFITNIILDAVCK